MAMESKSRFDETHWVIKQGIYRGMPSNELLKKFGDKMRGNHYVKIVTFKDTKLMIKLVPHVTEGHKFLKVEGIHFTHNNAE